MGDGPILQKRAAHPARFFYFAAMLSRTSHRNSARPP
jgi:hypothetical protein